MFLFKEILFIRQLRLAISLFALMPLMVFVLVGCGRIHDMPQKVTIGYDFSGFRFDKVTGEQTACNTKQVFSSREARCEGLNNEDLNNDCAVEQRRLCRLPAQYFAHQRFPFAH